MLEKKVVGNQGSNFKKFTSDKVSETNSFLTRNAQRLVFFCVFWYWEWLDWMRWGNNFSSFFFPGELGAFFFLGGGEYLCHSPAIRCRASWRIAKQHIFLGKNIRRLIRICQKQLMWFSSHQAVSLKDVGSFNFLLAARCSSWYLYVWCIYDVYTYIYICIYSIYIYLIDKCLYTDNLSQGCRWSEVL